MITPRSWKWALLLTSLTLLLVVPLWQLSSHASTGYYRKQAKDFYDNVSSYFTHEQEVYNNTLYLDGTENHVHAQYNFSMPCEGFPNTDGIMLVMKTGATESYAKLPTQLLTTMSCLPDFLIFSDLEQQIGKYHVHNVLDRVNETVKKAHKEFELYDAQQRCPVSQADCTADMSGGWDLDKYKFLNMIERTWEKRPDMEWYVFAEADTYVVWSNLVQWLRERAPGGDAYVGSVALLNGFPFAHGGSGYVISGSLMRNMVENITDLAAKYDERAGKECCGDLLISLAADEAGTKVMQAHPMFNGEKPNTLPYGNGHWCEPLLTMHHVNSEEVSAIWQYEQTRKNKTEIMQIKDMYQAFMAPYLVSFRRDWDNMSDDTCYIGPEDSDQERAGDKEKGRQKAQDDKSPVEKNAHVSPAACAKVCESAGLDISEDEFSQLENDVERGHFIRERYLKRVEDDHDGGWRRDRSCFQWKYQKGACCTSKNFKLGKPRHEDDENRVTSGWYARGINDWVEAKGDCEEPDWRKPF